MIKLYEKGETNFRHNKYVMTDILKIKISEKVNGMLLADFEYPIDDSKGIAKLIKFGNYIKAPVPGPREDQIFVIEEVIKNSKDNVVLGKCRCYGQHTLGANFIQDTNIIGKTRGQACQQLLDNCMDTHKMKVKDDGDTMTENMRVVRYSPLQALLGKDDNTIINRFGGDIQFDNFNVCCYKKLGKRSKTKIKHAHNLLSIVETLDYKNLITRIIPQGANELLLPEYYIDSPNINRFERVYNKHITFSEIGEREASEGQEAITKEQAYDLLRRAVKSMYEVQHVDELAFNYKVDMVSLRKSIYYSNYHQLEDILLGDDVEVLHKPMGLNLLGRVISYVYDPLTDLYDSLELGMEKKTISDAISDTVRQVTFTKQLIELSVENLDKTLSSKITITEQGITENITNVDKKLSTEITKVAGEVATKVSSGDVQTIITQSPTQVTTAFNDGSDCITMTRDGLTTRHSNGASTFLGNTGLRMNINGFVKDYHALCKVGVFNVSTYGDGNGTLVRVQLDDVFKGKTFYPQVAIQGWFSQNNVPLNISVGVQWENVNYNEGYFTVWCKGSEIGAGYFNNINVMYIVVA